MALSVPNTATGIAGVLSDLTGAPWWIGVLLLLPVVLQGVGAFIASVIPVVSQYRTEAMRRRILQRTDDQAALAHLERVQLASTAGPSPATDNPAAERQRADDTTESPP
ncbi:hypothetical protein [Streptomyces sp. NPDC093260]|uniref:hypothetical protein n=1 Tax=Streptomyces sp. NPDC093260 TaxID=3155073 RepID=UPI00342736E8